MVSDRSDRDLPDDDLPRGIARIWTTDGEVAGSGFLLAERTLCTCAHVVSGALGTEDAASTPPTTPVTVDFPLLTPPSARLRATVTHWRPVTRQLWLSAAHTTPGKKQWPMDETFYTDATGRFLSVESDSSWDASAPPDAGRVVMHDAVTGLRHSTVLPVPENDTDPDPVLVRGASGTPILYYATGQDLLGFRMHSVGYTFGADKWGSVDAMDHASRSSHTTVALLSSEDEDGGMESIGSVVAFDADGTRRVKLKSEYPSENSAVVAGADGSSLVVWEPDGWELRTGAGLSWKEGRQSPRRSGGETVPGKELRVLDVQRYGVSDFLLLDRDGLSLLDGKSGRRTVLRELGCEWGGDDRARVRDGDRTA